MNRSLGGFVVIVLVFLGVVNGSVNLGGAALTVWRFFSGGINAALGEDSRPIIINNPPAREGENPDSGYEVP